MQQTAFTLISVVDSLPMAVACISYMYLTRNWLWVCLASTCLSYLALFLAFFCPESPKWHLIQGRAPQAIDCLNEIAELNGVQESEFIPENAVFVEDPNNFGINRQDDALSPFLIEESSESSSVLSSPDKSFI